MVYIVIDGNIGSGKSTLIQKLIETYNYHRMPIWNIKTEDVSDWINSGWLEKYYQNDRFSFGFQMKVLLSHLKQFESLQNSNNIILERSAYTCHYVFGKMLLDEEKMDELEYKLEEEYLKNFGKKPDYIIYLKTDAKVTFERINKRSRVGENKISFDYIQKLNDSYTTYLQNSESKIYEINANLSEDEVFYECCAILEKIIKN
tara:strand:- start:369 stop:977 length:609 start_codon:yes stop_codon:yes gene_type:complete